MIRPYWPLWSFLYNGRSAKWLYGHKYGQVDSLFKGMEKWRSPVKELNWFLCSIISNRQKKLVADFPLFFSDFPLYFLKWLATVCYCSDGSDISFWCLIMTWNKLGQIIIFQIQHFLFSWHTSMNPRLWLNYLLCLYFDLNIQFKFICSQFEIWLLRGLNK